jgi:hypothetical protein
MTCKIIACFLLACCNNLDNDIETRQLIIQNHLFIPEELAIPANTKIKLTIHNKDDQAEEFECPSLRREKIIPSNATVSIIITPLKSGVYEFFGEFNKDTARGRIKVE